MIGIKHILATFQINGNQVARRLNISRQTVSDWINGKRKIPKERINQISHFQEFEFVDRELFSKILSDVEEQKVIVAYYDYLSKRDSKRVIDEVYGVPYMENPHEEDRDAEVEILNTLLIEEEKDHELKKAEALIYGKRNYSNTINSTLYKELLTKLNKICVSDDKKKISLLSEYLNSLTQNN
ncbi:helix-turn-helix domain-containing protein [Pontibacillus yanchengensis]|uniref:Helix-turn-helix domain-containing protein n=1 Tax=Pontibacillus yanchengensis TaxID=462910 RepID=A0A6I4ZY32_9BACI|nr:YdaS family helix-turn-helix protein [Pontibacillus yanchengensis]MYL33247.1 helix-turn-helix domain-containing protein [Pontibacillus yanchengensis]